MLSKTTTATELLGDLAPGTVGLLLEKKRSLRLPKVPQFHYFCCRNPFSFVLCKMRPVQKRLTRLAAALFVALQKSEQGGVFYSKCQYYGGSRLVRLVKFLRK